MSPRPGLGRPAADERAHLRGLLSHPPERAATLLLGTILGGVLFGLGWVVSGACPGVILAQLGEGKLYALFSLVGVAIGNWAYGSFLEARLGTAPKTA